MSDFMAVGVALTLTLPITAAVVAGLLFALFARASTLSQLGGSPTLQMNDDGTLSEATATLSGV